uniref:Molybdenum cofactor synthesis 2 n=1 Tax=Hippocampus comes TaxID=109280 RepID=A0A3Q3DSA9_HIPCM
MVCVLYFAKSAELSGVREELLQVDTPINSQDLWTRLLGLRVLQGHVVLAVRHQYVAIDDQEALTLRDGDEVAVVPPLSGG